MAEFIINDGVLEQYTGAGGDVVIPDGVTEIGESNWITWVEENV